MTDRTMEHEIKLTDRNAAAIALVNLAKANPTIWHNAEGSQVQVVFWNERNAYQVRRGPDHEPVDWDGYWDAVGHLDNSLAIEPPLGSKARIGWTVTRTEDTVEFSSTNGSESWTPRQAELLIRDLVDALSPVHREELVIALWNGWD